VEFINNKHGFYFVGCVCGLGEVYVGYVVGVENLCCLGQGFLKNQGSIPLQVIGFLDVF